MYAAKIRDQVSQGDIFPDLTFVRIDASGDVTTTSSSRHTGILLTYDCEYDKPRVDFVLVALVRPLSGADSNTQGNMRSNKVASAFCLAEIPAVLPEAFADFYHIVSVRKSEIARLAPQRIASLDDVNRLALQYQIALYFGHGRKQL